MKKIVTQQYARRAVNAGKLKIYGTCATVGGVGVPAGAYVVLQDNDRQRTVHAVVNDDTASCIEYALAGCPGYGSGTARACLVTWPTWNNI